MTHHSLEQPAPAATAKMSRSRVPPIIGNLAAIRAAIADKHLLLTRIEAAWVAAAEARLSKHLPKGVRLDDRATWDGPTYARYLAEVEKVEPEFKPRLRRLLTEIDALERLVSPASSAPLRKVA